MPKDFTKDALIFKHEQQFHNFQAQSKFREKNDITFKCYKPEEHSTLLRESQEYESKN